LPSILTKHAPEQRLKILILRNLREQFAALHATVSTATTKLKKR